MSNEDIKIFLKELLSEEKEIFFDDFIQICETEEVDFATGLIDAIEMWVSY